MYPIRFPNSVCCWGNHLRASSWHLICFRIDTKRSPPMHKVWIIVANSCQSTIYKAENNHHLTLHKTFQHEEGHLPAHDLVSDSQGRSSYPTMYGSDSMEKRTSVKTKEKMSFAHEISAFLEEGWKKK